MKTTYTPLKKYVPSLPVLSQLVPFTSQVQSLQHGIHCSSNKPIPRMSHAEFVDRLLPRQIPKLMNKYGGAAVKEELVQLALPLYHELERQAYWKESSGENWDIDAMGHFWSYVVPGRADLHEYPHLKNRSNSDMALRFGIEAVYGPIISLATVHSQTRVFSFSKYLNCHANRHGYIIDQFGPQAFEGYVEASGSLLRSGIYDWSIEFTAKSWDGLKPAIELYGFREVLAPIVRAMCNVRDIPWTKDGKYKHSYLDRIIEALIPYLAPRLIKDGPEKLCSDLRELTDFIRSMANDYIHREKLICPLDSDGVFNAFTGYLPAIIDSSIEAITKAVLPRWKQAAS